MRNVLRLATAKLPGGSGFQKGDGTVGDVQTTGLWAGCR